MDGGGDDKRLYTCRFCGKQFDKSEALGGHMNSHCQERKVEKYHEAAALLHSINSFTRVWGQINAGQGSFPNSNQLPPMGQNIPLGSNYGWRNVPVNTDYKEFQATMDYMEKEEARRLQFPMAGPSNLGHSGSGSGSALKFNPNLQTSSGEIFPLPSQYAHGDAPLRLSTPNFALDQPLHPQLPQPNLNMALPLDIQNSGNSSAVFCYRPPGMDIPIDYQSYANFQLNQPTKELLDLQELKRQKTVHSQPPLVNINNALTVSRPQYQQHIDNLVFPHSQLLQQQNSLASPHPAVNVQNVLTVNLQQFQQNIGNLGSPHAVLKDYSPQLQQQNSLPSPHPAINVQNALTVNRQLFKQHTDNLGSPHAVLTDYSPQLQQQKSLPSPHPAANVENVLIVDQQQFQQHITNFGSPHTVWKVHSPQLQEQNSLLLPHPAVNVQNVLTVDRQQFQQHIGNLGSPHAVLKDDSQQLQQQNSLPSPCPAVNVQTVLTVDSQEIQQQAINLSHQNINDSQISTVDDNFNSFT